MLYTPATSLGVFGGIDANTVLMLHFDGTDGSNDYVDSSQYAHTVSDYYTVLDDAQKKFGNTSMLSTSTGYYAYIADSADWYFTDDFTIDGWFRIDTWAAGTFLYDQGQSEALGRVYWSANSTNSHFVASAPGPSYQGHFHCNWTVNEDTWYHIAMERNGSNCNFYVNGTKQTTVQDTAWGTMPNVADNLRIGEMYGWVDEYRVSKGVARYKGNSFYPRTGPYTT